LTSVSAGSVRRAIPVIIGGEPAFRPAGPRRPLASTDIGSMEPAQVCEAV
jgi:hypothetical protein